MSHREVIRKYVRTYVRITVCMCVPARLLYIHSAGKDRDGDGDPDRTGSKV